MSMTAGPIIRTETSCIGPLGDPVPLPAEPLPPEPTVPPVDAPTTARMPSLL